MFFISCGIEQSNTENITDGPRHPAPQKLAAAFPIVTMQRGTDRFSLKRLQMGQQMKSVLVVEVVQRAVANAAQFGAALLRELHFSFDGRKR